MTKQDYVKIADMLNYCKPSRIAKPRGYAHRLEMWEGIVTETFKMLEKDNPRFDREKFLDRVQNGGPDGQKR